ncbi:MAG: hypothetical protein Devi2KO_00830 [Devosia indica]
MTDQPTADAKKVAYKAKLLTEQLGLAAALADAFAGRVHMIKAAERPGRLHRIMCADGSWIEIDPATCRVVRTWGRGTTAPEIAKAIAGDAVEHLEEEAGAVSAPGAPIRSTPVLSDERATTLADGWRQRGYTDLIEDARGVWVALPDGTRLFDVGQRVHVHGPRTDAALAAIAQKARDDWDSALALRGPGRDWPERDKARLWLACQREGVEYAGYEPSPALVAKWEAEQARSARGGVTAVQPGDVSAGPAPVMTAADGSTEAEPEAPAEPKSEAPDEPDLSAFERKAADLDRRQVDLERRQGMTVKERTEAIMREQRLGTREAQDAAFREQDRMREEAERLAEARAIVERAREIAIEKGLAYDSAVAMAKAEHLAEQEHDYDRRAGPRR